MYNTFMNYYYIGIMSGTSLDGVDVALCKIDDGSCHLEYSYYLPFDTELKEEVHELIVKATTIKKVGELDHKLALLFAKAVNALLQRENLTSADVCAIGLHGQTVWHEPQGEFPFSLQLGNASVVAVETGIDVVSDFRSKDVAVGGQGAPLAPAFHKFLFSHIEGCAVVNIGGMANISVFEPELIGYDTGCGNVLMDLWIKEHKNLLVLLVEKNSLKSQEVLRATFMNQAYIGRLNAQFIAILVTKGQKRSYPIEMLYTFTYPSLFFLDSHELFIHEPIRGNINSKTVKSALKEINNTHK